MYVHRKLTFEVLPDEIILEICRYLHCSHVLYSFLDLNSRLNQTITFYRQHVWFRRASYKQLLHINEYILPRIGSFVHSLTIHPLHYASFPSSFKHEVARIFPNLETLTLSSWTSENLFLFIRDTIQNMKYLQKLIIQELSCSTTIHDQDFLEPIFNNENSLLTNIIFDYDCDSFHLSHPSTKYIISHSILSLTIQLNTLSDLALLIHFIPNIQHLDVSFKNSSLKAVPFDTKLSYLKVLSIGAIYHYSNFDDLTSLFPIVPSIEQFSLTISTGDLNFIIGEKLLSILPVQLKQFSYAVCYYGKETYNQLNKNLIQNSWRSIPIVYSCSDIDKRIFLHTLPYSSSRLTIRSSLAKNLSIKDMYPMYSKIEEIQVYMMTNLFDTFPIIGQCRRIRELTLLTANEPTVTSSEYESSANTNKQPVKLPHLARLDILTIEGIPRDLHHLKDLLLAASNLSVLVIDFNCLLTLLEDENESLILYVLLHRHILDLCIRVTNNITKCQLTMEQIHCIARIFTRVRNLTIDYEACESTVDSNVIRSVLNEFPRLVIFHIYGKMPDELAKTDIRQWFIEQNYFRIKPTDIFRIECSYEWFKLWL